MHMQYNSIHNKWDVCTEFFLEDNFDLLSELVPLMNSNESGRSGGAYASLGTRQERVEGLRTLA